VEDSLLATADAFETFIVFARYMGLSDLQMAFHGFERHG
jgi:hypothetical protein